MWHIKCIHIFVHIYIFHVCICIYTCTYVNLCASTKGYVVTWVIFTDASRLQDTCIPILRQKLLILSLRSASRGASYPLASATRPRAGASEKMEIVGSTFTGCSQTCAFLTLSVAAWYTAVLLCVYLIHCFDVSMEKGTCVFKFGTLQCTDAQIALTTCWRTSAKIQRRILAHGRVQKRLHWFSHSLTHGCICAYKMHTVCKCLCIYHNTASTVNQKM